MLRSLVLADDHPILLDGLERLFLQEGGFVVLGRCVNGRETLETVLRARPDVLVLDLRMPQGGGISVLRQLAERRHPTRVVLLTAAPEDPSVAEAVRLGVWGVVLKEAAPSILVQCVRDVCDGRRHLGGFHAPPHARDDPERSTRPSASEALTAREVEIVREVSAGLRNREIARRLGISEGTVKIHLHHVYSKLDVEGRVEMLTAARRRGLI